MELVEDLVFVWLTTVEFDCVELEFVLEVSVLAVLFKVVDEEVEVPVLLDG